MIEAPSRSFAGKLRRLVMYPLAFGIVASLWELYKLVGPKKGGNIFGVRLLARTDYRSMPHTWEMIQRLSKPEIRGTSRSVAMVVKDATWYSLRISLLAFVVGTLLGLALAVIMARFKWAERALMPYLAVSQTVPIIVLAPLLYTLLTYASKGLSGSKWLAAALLGVFLAFFPVAVSALRGLQSAQPAQLELMDSYAASWWKTLIKLRLPAAVPYIGPALRLAGAAAVVGVIVAEISIGLKFGVGRLILSYGQDATSDPPKVYAAVFGAAALGIIMALLIVGIDKLMMRNRPAENN